VPRKLPKPAQPLTAIIATGFIIAGLYLAAEVLIPLAIAVLLTFLLAPLANALERLRIGRIASVLVSVVVMLLPLVLLVALMGNQIIQLTTDLPKYESNLRVRAKSITNALSWPLARFAKVAEQIEGVVEAPKAEQPPGDEKQQAETKQDATLEPSSDQFDSKKKAKPEPVPVRIVQETSLEDVGHWLGPVLSPLGMLAMIAVLVLFMLLEREDLRNRAILLVGRSNLPMATKAIDEAGSRVSRYLRMQLLVNSIYGVVIGLMVWLLGLPNPLFWGVAGTGMRFIPYIGPWVTGGGIFLLSLAVTSGWTIPLIVIGTIAVLELILNNVLEPWLYGSSAGLTSVGVIVAAIFWTWLWNAPGLFLSTPLTVCICVLGRYFPRFEFAAILLSDAPPLPAESRFYQRLLATDNAEAKQVVTKMLKDEGLEALFEKLLLPTLSQAEVDYQAGDLDETQRVRVHDALLQTAEDAEWQREVAADTTSKDAAEQDATAAPRPAEHRVVTCVPGHGIADQISTQLVAEYLSTNNYESHATSDAALCSEVLQQVGEIKPDVVLVSTLAPYVGSHARYLCKRLRLRFPNTPVIVGIWNSDEVKLPLSSQIKSAGWQAVVKNLSELTDWLENRAAPMSNVTQQKPPTAAAG
jgi:predicted PurR-regulated permease PerM/CheY-like chemotaxis protein